MRVSEQNGIYPPHILFESLVTKVWTSIDQDYSSIVECKAGRGSVPMISWVFGGADLAGTPRKRNSSRGA